MFDKKLPLPVRTDKVENEKICIHCGKSIGKNDDRIPIMYPEDRVYSYCFCSENCVNEFTKKNNLELDEYKTRFIKQQPEAPIGEDMVYVSDDGISSPALENGAKTPTMTGEMAKRILEQIIENNNCIRQQLDVVTDLQAKLKDEKAALEELRKNSETYIFENSFGVQMDLFEDSDNSFMM